MTDGMNGFLNEMHAINISGKYLVLLRLTLGFAFITTWASNFLKGVFTPDGYTDLVTSYINSNIGTPYNTFVKNIILPNAGIFSFIQIILELTIATSLIFGLFTRLGSLLGLFMSINLFFLTLGVEYEWPWTYILMIVGFLICAIYSVGRIYGFDFWLEKKLPRYLQVILI
ncbi:MAG: DoxX family protein [Candidatus Thorarchaeota archaeon]